MSVTTGSASNIKKLNRIRAICMVGLGQLSKPFVKAFPFIVPQRGKAFVNKENSFIDKTSSEQDTQFFQETILKL